MNRLFLMFAGLAMLIGCQFPQESQQRGADAATPETLANVSLQEEQKLFDQYKAEAWSWTSKQQDVRLTKTHGLPSFYEGAIVYTNGKPNKIRYAFVPMGRQQYSKVKPGDILTEYDLNVKRFTITFPQP